MRKAQILENRDKTERGDKIYYRTIEPSVLPEERIGATAGELIAIAPSISYIERPLRAKRPGLVKLLRRIPCDQYVVINGDGSSAIQQHSDWRDCTNFLTIDELKAHLLTLPKPQEKA